MKALNLDKLSLKDTVKLLKEKRLDASKFIEQNTSQIREIANLEPSAIRPTRMTEMLTTLALELKEDPHYGTKFHREFPNVSAKASAILDMFSQKQEQAKAQVPDPQSETQLVVYGGRDESTVQASSSFERAYMNKLPFVDTAFLDLDATDNGARITSRYQAFANQLPRLEVPPKNIHAYFKGRKGVLNIERNFKFMEMVDSVLEVEVSQAALARSFAGGQATYGWYV